MNDLVQMLEQTALRLFSDHSTPAVVERAEHGTWPADLWRNLEETGLTVMLVPEDAGGAGGSLVEAGAVLRLAARFSAPVPLGETLLATQLLADAGLEIPQGPLSIAPVTPGDALALERTPTGWLASGTLQRIPWGSRVDAIVALGSAAGEPVVALLPTSSATTHTSKNLAGEPRDTLTFDTVRLPMDAVAPAPVGVNVAWLRRRGALVRAVQIAGGLEQILDLGVEYAQQRTQFGRPLGNFQVIQHQLVQLAGETSTARAAADLALRIAGSANEHFAIAAAKARASAAVAPAAAIAHQVHGAIGFTQEHRLQLSTRRLWAWRDEFGSETYWNMALGTMALDAGPDAFWPALAVSHVKQGE